MRRADVPAVRRLQRHLAYADPALPEAAVDGPFVGRVAVEERDATSADEAPAPASDPARIVGYAVALPGAEATLSELVVAPDSRRSGHGRRLVAAVSTATDADRLVVTTPVDAGGARRFYEALGFEADARLTGFYGDREDGAEPDAVDALRLVRRE